MHTIFPLYMLPDIVCLYHMLADYSVEVLSWRCRGRNFTSKAVVRTIFPSACYRKIVFDIITFFFLKCHEARVAIMLGIIIISILYLLMIFLSIYCLSKSWHYHIFFPLKYHEARVAIMLGIIIIYFIFINHILKHLLPDLQ